jgi:hypothetical protein
MSGGLYNQTVFSLQGDMRGREGGRERESTLGWLQSDKIVTGKEKEGGGERELGLVVLSL